MRRSRRGQKPQRATSEGSREERGGAAGPGCHGSPPGLSGGGKWGFGRRGPQGPKGNWKLALPGLRPRAPTLDNPVPACVSCWGPALRGWMGHGKRWGRRGPLLWAPAAAEGCWVPGARTDRSAWFGAGQTHPGAREGQGGQLRRERPRVRPCLHAHSRPGGRGDPLTPLGHSEHRS